MFHRTHSSFWILAAVSLLIIFFNLGGPPLMDPDEPVYAETPKEMIASGDYVSPRIYGEFWYDKPPMYYWLVAGSFRIFGQTDFAARFPSAVLGVACVFVVYFFGMRLFNRRAAFGGALILATSLEFYYLSKAAVTDMTLLFTLTVCLLAFVTRRYYLFYAFAGLATVTKGPIGFLFPAAILFFYCLLARRWQQLRKIHILPGLVLYAAVAVPWYAVMYSLHGMDFINTFLGFHNITRFTSPEHPEGLLWYYFIPVLAIGFFPWTAVLLQALWSSLRAGSRDFSKLVFLDVWAIFIFVFFSISQTKLVSYILPVFPPLALVTGWYIDQLCDLRGRRRIVSWPVITTALTVLLAAGLWYGSGLMPVLRPAALLLDGLLLAMLVGMWLFYWQREPARMLLTEAVAMVCFSMVVFGMMLPKVTDEFSSREIATQFVKQYDRQSPVYIVKFLRPGVAFYTDVYGQAFETNDELYAALDKPGKAYFILRRGEYRDLRPVDLERLEILSATADKYVLVKR